MKKIKKILIGTHNQGKYKEISQLLPKEIKKVSPINLKIKSPKETGKSFLANSKLKANYFFRKSNIPSLSDDSGLCIECLNGNQVYILLDGQISMDLSKRQWSRFYP